MATAQREVSHVKCRAISPFKMVHYSVHAQQKTLENVLLILIPDMSFQSATNTRAHIKLGLLRLNIAADHGNIAVSALDVRSPNLSKCV